MTNDNLRAAMQHKDKLDQLKKILKSGGYNAAGLKFELQVGEDGEYVEFSLGLSADLNAIMAILISGVEASYKTRLRWAQEELKELTDFFDELPFEGPTK